MDTTEMLKAADQDRRLVGATASDAVHPFRVNFSDVELAELRRRISATRWPERETVTDESQGVQLATLQDLAHYWGTDYDWRKVYQAPWSWAERAYHKFIYYNNVAAGGHYAAWEQPRLFSEEVRAGFRSLRNLAV